MSCLIPIAPRRTDVAYVRGAIAPLAPCDMTAKHVAGAAGVIPLHPRAHTRDDTTNKCPRANLRGKFVRQVGAATSARQLATARKVRAAPGTGYGGGSSGKTKSTAQRGSIERRQSSRRQLIVLGEPGDKRGLKSVAGADRIDHNH